MVILMEEWPKRSETTLGGTPAQIMCEAWA